MVAWNNVMRWQYYGYAADITTTFIRPTAPGKTGRLLEGMRGSGDVFRDTTNFYQRGVYFWFVLESEQNMFRMQVDGSDRLLYKEFIEVLSPYDMAGLKFVIERPVDQYKGDQIDSYLPNERRVREDFQQRSERTVILGLTGHLMILRAFQEWWWIMTGS